MDGDRRWVSILYVKALLSGVSRTAPRLPEARQEIDAAHVHADFTSGAHTIGAVLAFAPGGELIDFRSEDRTRTADGKTFERLPWSTPLSDYRDFGGARLAGAGQAVWHTSEGEFVYIRTEMLEIEYNVAPDTRR
jgi:hypothetical protein